MRHLHHLRALARAAVPCAALAALLVPTLTDSSAQAATATATLSVSASIAGACTVGSAALTFGAYASTAASTASSAIQVSCTNGTSAVVTLNQGNNNNRVPSSGTRALNNGTNYLGYDIYTDNTYSTVWNATNSQPVVSTGSPVTITA